MAKMNLNLVSMNLGLTLVVKQDRAVSGKLVGLHNPPAILSHVRSISPSLVEVQPPIEAETTITATYTEGSASRIGRSDERFLGSSGQNLLGSSSCQPRFGWQSQEIPMAIMGNGPRLQPVIEVSDRVFSTMQSSHRINEHHDYPSHDVRDAQRDARKRMQKPFAEIAQAYLATGK